MNWLCDTNVISESFKKKQNMAALNWLRRQERLSLSVVTVEEIFCGLSHLNALKKMEWFERFLRARCDILPISPAIARRCGMLRGRFLKNGVTRTQADLFIASTAIEHQLALSTRNIKDFEGIDIPLLNPFTEPFLLSQK
ncbi:MAG: type II toxin-antitoxin system VapC family toxin [Desulfobacterales bacterium]|nr:type II toxin-antitoxin system VapC family toxin [Desulfobacterales bacterium]